MTGLRGIHDQAQADAARIEAMLQRSGDKAITPAMIRRFALAARERIRLQGRGYRREGLRALAQRVDVAEREGQIGGSTYELLRTLTGSSEVKTPTKSVPVSVGNGGGSVRLRLIQIVPRHSRKR